MTKSDRARQNEQREETVQAQAAEKPKILIVEDEPMLQEAYKHVLTFKGYTVFTADNGEEGLEQLERYRPDVVLLDVLMPRLDGIGFLRQADMPKNYPDVVVVACSNLSDQVTADKLTKYGAHKQVLKSDLSPSQLIELVETFGDAGPSSQKSRKR